MLVVFRSKAAQSVTMFEKDARELLKLMGATGLIPGGYSPEDVPAAYARLESAIERIRSDAGSQSRADSRSDDEEDKEERAPPVGVATRAVPLLDLLKRAAAARAEVTWQAR